MVTKLISMALLSLTILGSFAVLDSADACGPGKVMRGGRCVRR